MKFSYLKTFIIVTCFLIVAGGCRVKPSSSATYNKILPNEDYSWLLGRWVRLDGTANAKTYEHWVKHSPTLYKGHGYTIENGDTTFQERMTIPLSPEAKVFNVHVNNEPTTSFTIVSKSKQSLICENQENPFPKVIQYIGGQDSLKAQIYGGGPTINFTFIRYANQ